MKPILTFAFSLLVVILPAQSFSEFQSPPMFEGKSYGSVTFADVDGDGDEDALLDGFGFCDTPPLLYENDGNGVFSLMQELALSWIYNPTAILSDVDGDNDPDLLLYGYDWYGWFTPQANLYINDGFGNFSASINTISDPVAEGSMAFWDVDGDGDEDLLMTGTTGGWVIEPFVTKLYKNDGSGNFTEVPGASFEGFINSSIAFSDVDGDNDPDVLIAGINDDDEPLSKLYVNDGTGLFSEDLAAILEGVSHGALAFNDMDGDNDHDLLLSGLDKLENPVAILYSNNGTGQFQEEPSVLIDPVAYSAIALSDIDDDNDLDVLITGWNSLDQPSSKLYRNEGNLVFNEVSDVPFIAVSSGGIAFSDVDDDGDEDVLISGAMDFPGEPISNLYLNDGTGNFSGGEMVNSFFGIMVGAAGFSDADGDGDQDLLLTGANNNLDAITRLYNNDGSGLFTENSAIPFADLRLGSIAFVDVDGDGDEDVLITGMDLFDQGESKLYYNEGDGQFEEALNTPFMGVFDSSVAFSDIDGDNDQDLLLTGSAGNSSNNIPYTRLYRNQGDGMFLEEFGAPFYWISHGAVAFADIDGDNDQDVLITGWSDADVNISILYVNDGTGDFDEVTDTPFEGVRFGDCAFSDVDGDGDEDVLITGRDNADTPISKLYLNDGDGIFTEDEDVPFVGVQWGTVAFSDVDLDGDEDVLIAGGDMYSNGVTKLYTNNGSGDFNEVADTLFAQVFSSSIAFADVDGDGVEDVFLAGAESNCFGSTWLYINEAVLSSVVDPESPGNPVAFVYPNPTFGEVFYIRYNSKEQSEVKITLADVDGKILWQLSTRAFQGWNDIPIEVSNLPQGLYFLKLEDRNSFTALKFIHQ